jgi:RNA polymerase sigma factor (sigma-70 family)
MAPGHAWRDSDDRLVELVRAGDHRAFQAIVERYRDALFRYCRRLLPAAEAEEAVQETFIRAHQGIRGGEEHLILRPWLYRIALNVSLDLLRRERVQRRRPTNGEGEAEPPARVLELREEVIDVLRAIRALPPRQREALLLQAFEGRRYDDIAARLGVSDQAVRQLLNRARTTLREAQGRPRTARGGEPVGACGRRPERRKAEGADRRRRERREAPRANGGRDRRRGSDRRRSAHPGQRAPGGAGPTTEESA